jgi:hypothetical protein
MNESKSIPTTTMKCYTLGKRILNGVRMWEVRIIQRGSKTKMTPVYSTGNMRSQKQQSHTLKIFRENVKPKYKSRVKVEIKHPPHTEVSSVYVTYSFS